MNDVRTTGSIYDKLINEQWFTTPDMGEYQNNKIYLDAIKGLSSEEVDGDGNLFFTEAPPTLETGYHPDLEVVAMKLKAKNLYPFLTQKVDGYSLTEYNVYDGDTVYVPIEYVEDNKDPFKLYYSDNVYNGVLDYITRSMKITNMGDVPSFGLRFVGINAPEIVHYGQYRCSLLGNDIYTAKYKDLVSGSTKVQMIKPGGNSKEEADIQNITFRKFKETDGDPYTFEKRDPEEDVKFIKIEFPKSLYPNYAKEDRIEYHEYIDEIPEQKSNSQRVCKLVKTCSTKEDITLEYYNQAKKAQKIVQDAFRDAEDCIVLLDTNGLNNKKKNLPDHYLKSYERSSRNPFYALYDMWNFTTGQNVPAYKYSGYRIPGQEANGRFLAAIYVKVINNGQPVWINLNKKVLYECNLVELAEYSSSIEDYSNYGYLADGFKIWTYRNKNQVFIDYLNKQTEKDRDDREEIQSKIAGCNLKEMEDHTVMIGDTLFMIPPTSIKVINQTKTLKHHQLRAKGALNKTLPKTERIIQLDLFFNEDAGINGIPYEQKLPNGKSIIYYMNGLRGLIAQFKLTPFLPIHNSYINKTLGIDAVSLVSYSVSTMPNYPRTLQVTLMMYEFEWIQFLPCQAVPNMDENLYTNGYSNTIYFPLLRWHYQKALIKGEEIKRSLNFANMTPDNPSYIAATLGSGLALQPADFKEPNIQFYVPDEQLLDLQKQLKIKLATSPLGTTYEFNDRQKTFIERMPYVEELRQEIMKAVRPYFNGFCETGNENTVGVHYVGINDTKIDSYEDMGNAVVPQHFKSDGYPAKDAKTMKKDYIDPAYEAAVKLFKEKEKVLGNLVAGIEMSFLKAPKGDEVTFKFSIDIVLNEKFFPEESEYDLIKQYCAKQNSLTQESIFEDNRIPVSYITVFENKYSEYLNYVNPMKKALEYLSNESTQALEFLSALNDTDTEIVGELEDLKDSMDTEDENTINFFHYDLGEGVGETPIITNITSTYNNIFANVGLKAVDGHAAQYTGGSDSTIDIEMIGGEYTAGQVQLLNRVCMDYLLKYRKILKNSPLRIDSDFTRLLGIYEVIIDSISIDTIPENPGKFKIGLRLSSVDRTLRNRENLTKIKGLNNANIEGNEIVNTKSYFDLKQALGKAELYPDLQLPTVKELETAGFYFIKNKYQPERVYVDPDFYFVYWYPSLAETLRTSICEFFSDPQDLNYNMSDDLFNDAFRLRLNVGSKEEYGELYEVLNWDEANHSYDEFVEKIRKLVEEVDKDEKEKLTQEQKDALTDYTASQIAKFNKTQSVINSLQETIDLATDNVYNYRDYVILSVADIDILDESSTAIAEDIQAKNKAAIEVIMGELKNKIKGDDYKEPEGDPWWIFKRNAFVRLQKKQSVINELAAAMTNQDSSHNFLTSRFDLFCHIVQAAAVGAMAKNGLYGINQEGQKFNGSSEKDLYYPPQTIQITNSEGEKEDVPICLYESEKAGEYLIAHDYETRMKGTFFGKFAIKRYSAEELSIIFNRTITKPGFLDPYYNAELAKIMFDETMSDETEEERINDYIYGVLYDNSFILDAFFRQMLVWIYILMNNGTYLNQAFVNCEKLLKLSTYGDDMEGLYKALTGEDLYEDGEKEEIASASGKLSKKEAKKLYKKIVGTAEDSIEDTEEKTEKMLENMQQLLSGSMEYAKSLVMGVLFSASAIAMSGLDSSVLRAITQGDIQAYADLIANFETIVNLTSLSEEEQRMAKFVQYFASYKHEADVFMKNNLMSVSYNNRVQRVYMKAAEDPKTFMLHSYYDMVVNDKRGTMARAFPTYYMLLIDEGRQIGLWRLQDNFYDMNSIIEFEVVKSRKIAADTARIVMTNLYGIFTSEDEDMKDENAYSMRDVWDSIWSPKKYYKKEYARRENTREINRAKMQPGARVHLRMGYTSNAASLPIVFNGSVAEFEAGDTMTLICQGDGVELANPHMFNAIDGKDIKDIQHNDQLFGIKQLFETWDNLATPRDLLVLPLAAEGTWGQEIIRKISNGRFFNSNPFGIVHFGDRKFQTIFPTNGEVEQNIYEAISKASFNYKKSGIKTVDDGIEKEYRMSQVPKVKVKMESGKSYWDIMGIAASLSPDFISAIAPFQLRSTIFHGHPRFYYAYDYVKINGKILEKRKPYQQYHIYTSYSDIIENKISTSAQDVRTNAIGYYTGPSWFAKKTNAVGPLFVDIDIFPEYQKSTSFNLGFEYKNNDVLPFNFPITDALVDKMNLTIGPNGYQTAWRATANGLKDCVKDMYKGELIVMGDPTVKPFDRMVINDVYEDISGTCEVESVVHMFSTDTGFTTSVTPDCISAIDNKYETVAGAINQQVVLPALIASSMLFYTNMSFNRKNRMTYLAVSNLANKGVEIGKTALNSIMTIVGKDTVVNETMMLGSKMPEVITDLLQIDKSDIQLYDMIKDITRSVKSFSAVEIKNGPTFIKALNSIENLQEILDATNDKSLDALEAILKTDRYADSGAHDELIKLSSEIKNGIKTAQESLVVSVDDLKDVKKAIDAMDDKTDDLIKLGNELAELIKENKKVNLLENKNLVKSLKALEKVDDFTSTSTIKGLTTALNVGLKNADEGIAVATKLDDVAKAALSAKRLKTGFSAVKGLVMSNLITLAIETVLVKGTQEFLTRKLRNLQVLTVFPLKKDNNVWTAGLNGHQGSVYGSLAYDEPGWFEKMAISFFDETGVLGILRDVFITTDEMREIVNGYKRGQTYQENAQSAQKIRDIQISDLLNTTAKANIQGYTAYKKIYLTSRIKMSQIKNKDDESKLTYAKWKMPYIDNIETTKDIALNLENVITNNRQELNKKLYEKGLLKLSYEEDVTSSNFKLVAKKIMLDESNAEEVKVKELTGANAGIYDIPYLRPDACTLFNNVIQKIVSAIQPNYTSPTCEFENLAKHPIILHSATRINSNKGWRSTGFLFTIEVKNYDNFSNIISEIENEKSKITASISGDAPFTVQKEVASEFGINAYTFFLHCPKEGDV